MKTKSEKFGLLSDVALRHVLEQPLSRRFCKGVQAQELGRNFRNGFTTIEAWCNWFSALAESSPGIYRCNKWVLANEQKIDEAFALRDKLFPYA